MSQPAPTRTLHVNGDLQLAVHDFGGEGPALLLAHATGFHAHVWLPIVEHLRDSFHCYAFDERGHGDSTAPRDGSYDWHAFATDALAVVDDLGLEKPYGAGHSCGGALLLLAEQSRPETFRSLWCYEPVIYPILEPPPPEATRANPLAEGARRRREVFPSREAAYENYSSKPPFNRLAPEGLAAYVDHGFDDLPDGTVRLKCRGEDEAATYAMAGSHTAFRDLPQVRCRVTVVCGEQTDAFGPSIVEAVAERLPQGRAGVLPGLTHFGPLEDPAAIAASIRDALLAPS